jgi:hypothetical protein
MAVARGGIAPAVLVGLLATACGRPATLEECNEIVSRITQLELKARGSGGQDQETVKDTVEALRKTTLKECVGRRIDDGAMACVRSATNAQQLVKECF